MKRRSVLFFVMGVSLVVMMAFSEPGGGKRLTSDDVRRVEGLIKDLRRSAATDVEEALVSEIETRCQTLVFMRAEGVECRKALESLVRAKATPFIAKGLRHQNLQWRTEAARALGQIGDRTVVPCLLETLKEQNVVAEGSSETVRGHLLFKKQLISSISTITGLELDPDLDDDSMAAAIVDKTEDWLRQQEIDAEEKTFTREKLLNDMRKGEFLEARQAIQVCVKRDNMGLVRAALTNPRDDIKLMAAKSLVKDIEVTIEALIGTLERNADIAEGGDEATIRRELKEGLVRYIGRALGREYALANADSAEEIGKLVKEMRRDLLTPTKGKE